MSSHQTLRQTLMLEEMGIAPRWQARETNATAVTDEAAQVSTPNAAERVAVPAADDRRAGIMRMDWNEVKASVSECTSCALCQRRNKTVFGVGDENANWLFVGEGRVRMKMRKANPLSVRRASCWTPCSWRCNSNEAPMCTSPTW